jgi:signal transduction histidine kinase
MDFTDFRELAAAERQARERITKLQAVTAALSEAILPNDVAHVVAHEMAAVLGASQAVLAVPTADNAHLTLLGSSGLQHGNETRYATFSVDADFPVAAAFRTGKPVWISSRDELLRQHPGLPTAGETRSDSLACVPLKVKGASLGAIGFGYFETHAFDPAARALIEDLARQAALALERARLYEAEQTARRQAERAGAETEALLRLSQAAAAASGVDPIYDLALDAILELLRADRASLSLFDEDGVMRLVAWRGLSDEHCQAVDGHSPWAPGESTARPILIGDVAREPRAAAQVPLLQDQGIQALGCVPLAYEGQMLGTFVVYFAQPRSFSMHDEQLALAVASQAAQAVVRARLRVLERQTRDRATFMAEASRVLATSLDVQATLKDIAHLAVPALADWSTVELAEHDGTGKSNRVAVVHIDPEKVAFAHRLHEHYPPDPDAPHGVPHVLRTGVSELYETIPDELLVQGTRDAEHLRIARELGLKSAMTVPIRVQDRILGTISFVSAESSRRYTRSDLEMAEELGRRAGLALESARLFEAERTSRDGAERLAERLTLLHGVSSALSAALTTQAVAQAMALHAARAVSCQSGGVWVLSESQRTIDLLESFGPLAARVIGYQGDRGDRRVPLDSTTPLPLLAAIRSGDALWFESEAELAAYPEMLSAMGDGRVGALAVLPLRIEYRTLGALTFDFDQPQRFPEEVRAYLRLLAQHAAQALERARLYEAEREARKAEAAARQQAEAASHAREEILAVVSHDLRNPLNVILMSSTSLRGLQLADKQGQRVRTTAERIERASERMARLIGDLVDFASIQSGQLAVHKAATPVSEIIDATFEMFAGPADELGVLLDRRVGGALPPVDCDRDRVIQVLANMISNAIKVTSAGGRVAVGVEHTGAEMVFSVRDTGPGISEDELSQVFERYWRSKKVAYKGSGLGLTIAKGIIDAHRGRIWIESSLGAGSTFYFSLPAAPATGS